MLSPAAGTSIRLYSSFKSSWHESGWAYQLQQLHPKEVFYQRLVLWDGSGRLTAAFPPSAKIFNPHFAARGCVHAIMPSVLCTTLLRLGKVMNSSFIASGKGVLSKTILRVG